MDQPDPLDTAGVIDALRTHGSTLWPAQAIPVEFTDWRRRTRAANLRISVRRVSGMVLVEHLDHIVTEDRACYDAHRARGNTHHQALRTLANRLVGILHGCLAHHQIYDEATAWPALAERQAAAA